MKILFILKNENFSAPIGICAISAIAKKDGHEVFLSETHKEEPVEAYKRIKPDLVAYSSSTGESKHYVEIDRKLKEQFPKAMSVIGGPHPTFYPNIVNETTIDIACRGEGEGAFEDLLNNLANNRPLNDIDNICTKKFYNLEVRNLIEDLDTLPFPDYSIVYDNTELGKYPLKSVIYSKNCPYSCTYCFNTAWRKLYENNGGSPVRKHSVDYIIEDLIRIKKTWPLSTVKFQDDVFAFKVDDWLEDFTKKYKKEIGLPFFAYTRCDLINEDMVKLLKEAGCKVISMSIEAGNPIVRKNLLRRNMTNKQIIDTHLLCEKYGISTLTNSIIAIPDTVLKQDVESLDLALSSRITWGEFPIFFPFPKTELGEYAIKKGYYKPDYTSMHSSVQSVSVLSSFTTEEKNIQSNFDILASIILVFPMLKGFIINHSIFYPMNKLHTFTYWLVKNYVFRKYIYITKTNLFESAKIFFESLNQELFRHTKEGK